MMASIDNLALEYSVMKHWRALTIGLFAAMLLSACTEGGGAGDTDENPQAVEVVQLYIGLYDLPDNWAGGEDGVPISEAYLEIQAPNVSGVAVALIYRVDDINNCIEARPTQGEVRLDQFLSRVVLDDVFELENAILALSNNGLTITLPEDIQDIDGDGNTSESATFEAPRTTFMPSDLGETCLSASTIWL